MANDSNIYRMLSEYDRRYIYVILFVLVTAMLFYPQGYPLVVGGDARQYHDYVQKIKAGDKVLFNLNTEFSGYNEIQSGVIATLRILVAKQARICFVVGHPEATGIPELLWEKLSAEMKAGGYEYGKNYINLGYIYTSEAIIVSMAQDFKAAIRSDYKGQPISGTFLDEIKDWSSWQLISEHTSGIATVNIQNHFALRGTPMVVNGIALYYSSYKPYLDTGLFKGLLAGTRGGAEVELILGAKGPGLIAMDAFTMGHFLLIGLIIIGNIGYFGYSKGKEKR